MRVEEGWVGVCVDDGCGCLALQDGFPYQGNEAPTRLFKVAALLDTVPVTTRIHLELASIADLTLHSWLRDEILARVDSVGANEQELSALHDSMRYGTLTSGYDYAPRVSIVLDQMRYVMRGVKGGESL